LKKLVEFVDDLGIACTFFVVPDDHTCQAPQYCRSLQVAVDHGHELSLHGYAHVRNEFGLFYPPPGTVCCPIPIPTYATQRRLLERGRERLLKLAGARAEGFRAPNYLFNSSTLKALASLGLRYDSSATVFKTTHCSRFRVRWLPIHRAVMTNGVLEIPVTGDYTYNLNAYGFSASLETAMRDFELTRSKDGIFVLNNHPNRFGDGEFRFLKTLLNAIGRDSKFLRLVDIARSSVTH
jgi:peptidoglycan/xylan/chitin deacetylase (PgdA/CDA1 family)